MRSPLIKISPFLFIVFKLVLRRFCFNAFFKQKARNFFLEQFHRIFLTAFSLWRRPCNSLKISLSDCVGFSFCFKVISCLNKFLQNVPKASFLSRPTSHAPYNFHQATDRKQKAGSKVLSVVEKQQVSQDGMICKIRFLVDHVFFISNHDIKIQKKKKIQKTH